MKNFFTKNEVRIAKASIVVIFTGLIRCICEPFRLQYYSPEALTFNAVKVFVLGALVAAGGALIMVILFFYSKPKLVFLSGVVTIAAMLFLKSISNV